MVNFINSMMDTQLFVQRSVGQLMQGYEDELLDIAHTYMPDKVKSNTFSFLMGVRKKVFYLI